ncbi:MAG: DEAD/DEAH box helicase, partial [Hyphomicrobiaceae bacterium]
MPPVTFADLNLSAKVLSAVVASGYTIPTPIQAQAIPVAVTGRDILGIAQTGTGKTAAFVMPMITRLETGRARARMPRSLILAPTRELATQVAQSFEKYGVNHKLDLALLIGGVAMDEQIKKLDRGVDVLIATPGRLLDHFGRGRIMLMGVEILVIDEADRMLDMGFIPDIEKICKLLPPRRQTLFFSATMPPEITRLTEQFLTNPLRIEVAKPATTAKTITQRFFYAPGGEDWAKREILRDLLRTQPVQNAIIFCNRKRDVAILNKSLIKHGFNAGCLHGDMDQSSRTATLDKFRAGEITVLAASDVAARGLDIPEVSHVFNFDIPWQADDYVHRIGRTGRAGREGFSASIVTGDDFKALAEIAKITGEEPVWMNEAPTEAEIADGAKRKRGRGGRPASRSASTPRSASAPRSGSERPRGDSTGVDSPRRDRPRGDRPPRSEQQPRSDIAARPSDAPVEAGPEGAPTPRRQERSNDERRPRPTRDRRIHRTPDAQPAVAGSGDQPRIESQQRDQQPRIEQRPERQQER